MRPKKINYLYLLFIIILATNLALPKLSMAGGGPDDFIRSVGKNAINSLTNKKVTQIQREKNFRRILTSNFQIKLLARFTLGRFWRRTSERQKKEFTELFENFIVKSYASRFSNYKGEKFIVGKVRNVDGRDDMIQSALILTDGRKIPIQWRVRNISKYRIVDVIVEGVSMAITQRDEFSSIIIQNGGKIEGLLTALRKKTRAETQ